MSVSSIVAGEAYVRILAETSGLNKGLSKAQAALQKFASSSAMLMSQFDRPFQLLKSSFFVFQEFDDKMRLVKAVTGAVGTEFDMLTAKAKKLGRETRFTAGQVSEGMISLGRMGFSSKEIDASIASVMNLSTATGTELATASEIAANNMRVFGMRAEEMTDAADILTVTANGSAQNLVDLGEALKMAGPHAKNAGSDLKETCAACRRRSGSRLRKRCLMRAARWAAACCRRTWAALMSSFKAWIMRPANRSGLRRRWNRGSAVRSVRCSPRWRASASRSARALRDRQNGR